MSKKTGSKSDDHYVATFPASFIEAAHRWVGTDGWSFPFAQRDFSYIYLRAVSVEPALVELFACDGSNLLRLVGPGRCSAPLAFVPSPGFVEACNRQPRVKMFGPGYDQWIDPPAFQQPGKVLAMAHSGKHAQENVTLVVGAEEAHPENEDLSLFYGTGEFPLGMGLAEMAEAPGWVTAASESKGCPLEKVSIPIPIAAVRLVASVSHCFKGDVVVEQGEGHHRWSFVGSQHEAWTSFSRKAAAELDE